MVLGPKVSVGGGFDGRWDGGSGAADRGSDDARFSRLDLDPYPVDPARHFCDVGGIPRPGSPHLRQCRCGRFLFWTGRRWKHPGKFRMWLMRTWISQDYGMGRLKSR